MCGTSVDLPSHGSLSKQLTMLCLMRLCCGFLAAPNIPPPCRWSLAQRAARCRQCDRKLVVGVQHGLAASAQLVEAPLAATRLRCSSAAEHARGQRSSGLMAGAGTAVALERPALERERDAMAAASAVSRSVLRVCGGRNSKIRLTVLFVPVVPPSPRFSPTPTQHAHPPAARTSRRCGRGT